MKRYVCLFVMSCALVYAGCGNGTVSSDSGWTEDVQTQDLVQDSVDDSNSGEDAVDDNGGFDADTDTGLLVDTDDPGDTIVSTDVVDQDSTDVIVSTEVNYLVITSDSLLDSATELAQYRQSRGYRTAVITRSDVLGSEHASVTNWENMARGHIAQLANKLPEGETMFVVLVGDAEAVSAEGFTKPLPTVDCDNVLTGVCYTDNAIADLDDDYVPDVAIGRITASTNADVRAYLDKVMQHESGYNPGLWNRKAVLYVGEPGFSPEIDATLEYFTFQGLDLISHAFDIIGAYDSENSSYYYAPFHDKVVSLINEGALMSLYIGHGSPEWTQGLTVDQIDEINCVNRLPVMIFLACLNGHFDNDSDSISEALLHHENGPVSVFASTDESHPVGNAVLAYEITRVAFGDRPATVGELFMQTKDATINHDDEFRQTIDGASMAFGEQGADDPARIYREHADLYNLLGDPAVEMKYPPASIIDVDVAGTLAQKSVTVTGNVSGFTQGSAYVTLELTRNEFIGELNPAPENDFEIQANWAIANNKVFAAQTVDVVDGGFSALLEWEDTIGGGDRYIKIYAWDGTDLGEGAVDAIAEKWINR